MKMTKTAKRARAKTLSGKRRVANALKKFVRSNPALPAAFKKAKAVAMRKNSSGSVTIRVVKLPKVK
jgi:hypothetical protein